VFITLKDMIIWKLRITRLDVTCKVSSSLLY